MIFIWYNLENEKYTYIQNLHRWPVLLKLWWMTIRDVREIIFTPEFIEKYKEYFFNYYKDKHNQIWLNWKWSDLKLWLFNNLDKPVAYLYNKIINE